MSSPVAVSEGIIAGDETPLYGLGTTMIRQKYGVTPATRYSTFGLTLHWLMAIVVLVAFIYGPGGPERFVYAASRAGDRQIHETLGMLVFVLAVIRVLWRLGAATPEPPPAARWMLISARVVQGAMYALFFILPATAITGAWLQGHPLTLLAGVEIGPWLGESHEPGNQLAEIHGWLGDAILWLAGLHALAGLYHHFSLKDGVLTSMLPRRLQRGIFSPHQS